jgi:alpha-amylase
MGYEALGENQRKENGIFEIIKTLPYYAMEQNLTFITPSEATEKHKAIDNVKVPFPIGWFGEEKDLSVWNGNNLQQEALQKLYSVGERVRLCSDKTLQRDWLNLQATDHFRFMSHKDSWGSNYENAYEAFMNYMNILADFLQRVDAQYPTTIENEELNELLKTINNQEKKIETLESEIKKIKSKKK